MSTHLGPFEIECDAPPYAIVAACERLDLQSPLDVRWCRLSRFLNGRQRAATRHEGGFWKRLFGRNTPKPEACDCGHSLPLLTRAEFVYSSQRVAVYFLGQCPRCRTIFWENGLSSRVESTSTGTRQ